MPPSSSACRGSAMENFKLGQTQYNKQQYAEAARSFDRAITLGQKDGQVWEAKAKAHLRLSQVEARQFERTKAGPDGIAAYDTAYATAKRAEEKFKKERWQPYYILADIVYLKQQYSKAEHYLKQVEAHPSFRKSTPAQRSSVEKFLERVAHDRRYVRTRNAGRAEGEAIEKDLEREAQLRRRTNYEHVLSPDIFLRIVEVARDSDPRLPVRMSGVCKRWRATLVNQRGVWQRLILGKGKDIVLKVKTYLERCGGQDGAEGSGLRELRITEGFDWSRAEELGRLLKPHAPYIERLRLDLRTSGASAFLRHFRRLMASLRVLDIRGPIGAPLTTNRLDFDLLPLHLERLEELTLSGVLFRGETSNHHDEDEEDAPASSQADDDAVAWVERPAIQLASIAVLRLERCLFNVIPYQHRTLLQYMPLVREVDITHISTISQGLWDRGGNNPSDTPLRLENLERWSVTNAGNAKRDMLPDWVIAPNLIHVEYEIDFPFDPISAFRSETLREALPRLRSLSLPKAAIPDGFIEVLRDMTSLESLNLSRCSLSAKFLHDLARGASDSPRLLPNLVALSLAGNLELRAPVLRDLVNSRLPEDERIPIPAHIIPPKRKGPFGLGRTKSITTPASSQPLVVAPPPSLATLPPPPAKLRWLNIDLCENVDSALFPALERKLGFVSRSMSVVDEDRIRGKGRWDWELDIGAGCRWKMRGEGVSGGEEEKCEIRSNGKGGYHVYHVCCQAQVEEEKGWEWTSQVQRTQASASQAKRTDAKVRRARQGRISALQDE